MMRILLLLILGILLGACSPQITSPISTGAIISSKKNKTVLKTDTYLGQWILSSITAGRAGKRDADPANTHYYVFDANMTFTRVATKNGEITKQKGTYTSVNSNEHYGKVGAHIKYILELQYENSESFHNCFEDYKHKQLIQINTDGRMLNLLPSYCDGGLFEYRKK